MQSSELKKTFFEKLFKEVNVSKKDLFEYAELFEEKVVKKNEYFIHENEKCRFLGYVSSGILRGFILDYEGNEANIRFMRRFGVVSGNFGMYADSGLNIQSITDSLLWVAPFELVKDYQKNNLWLSKLYDSFLNEAYRNVIRKMSSYIRLNSRERYKLFIQEYPDLILQIPHYHIANYLGITSVQLSRIRKLFFSNMH